MSILHVSYDGMTVTVMRPENPIKSFASPDVPHGTDSVYVKAAKILVHSHGKSLPIPSFTNEEKATLVTTQEDNLSAVENYTDGEESKDILERTEVLNPTPEETATEFAKKDNDGNNLYENESAASAAIVAARKSALAIVQINERIDQCLEVPTVSQEFKDLFTTTETEE